MQKLFKRTKTAIAWMIAQVLRLLRYLLAALAKLLRRLSRRSRQMPNKGKTTSATGRRANTPGRKLPGALATTGGCEGGPTEAPGPRINWGYQSGLGHKPPIGSPIAEETDLDEGRLRMLEACRRIEGSVRLSKPRRGRLRHDSEGRWTRRRPLAQISEVGRLSPADLHLMRTQPAYFGYKLMSGGLTVRENVCTIERQRVFILVDGSDSMRGSKSHKAGGVVMSRLKLVADGEAEVWLSVFDTEMAEVQHASNAKEANALMEEFRQGNFTGGGTDVAACILAAHEWLEEQERDIKRFSRPQVWVLTDGDKSVSRLSAEQIPGTIVHGFAFEDYNPTLTAFANSTGGVGWDNF